MKSKIITIGIRPCWDISCFASGIDWGGHVPMDSQTIHPGGKSLNVSLALAGQKIHNIAAGLWGKDDRTRLLDYLASFGPFLIPAFTFCDGTTRQNVTIVDPQTSREMHLRAPGQLADSTSLEKLRADLKKLVSSGDICVFAGSLPDGAALESVLEIIDFCRGAGAKVVVDTSGTALAKVCEAGGLYLIKPNVEELSQLAGKELPDDTDTLIAAGESLLDRVTAVLISRGKNGCIYVDNAGNRVIRPAIDVKNVVSTVGCGDYLLAGFLAGVHLGIEVEKCLDSAVELAALRAGGN